MLLVEVFVVTLKSIVVNYSKILKARDGHCIEFILVLLAPVTITVGRCYKPFLA
jgi:hypothetical protein